MLLDCTNGDVRLVDGDNTNAAEGRVEYCVGGLWGTVCNFMWEDADATVLCRQLGLDALGKITAYVIIRISIMYCYVTLPHKYSIRLYTLQIDPRAIIEDVPNVNNSQTPIVLDGLNCEGSETSLDECGHLLFVEECSHSNDAGAFCQGWSSITLA